MRAAIALGLALAVAYAASALAGSTVVRSSKSGQVYIDGTGCGAEGSVFIPLPKTARHIRVLRPRIGEKGPVSRITGAAASGKGVRLTAVGRGPDVCDPAEDPDLPPAQRHWSDRYDYAIAFRERVKVRYWPGQGAPSKRRPRRVTIPLLAKVVHIHWRKFGGRRAIGFGRMRLNGGGRRCTARRCPGHGSRFKVVLSKPSRCADLGNAVYYGVVTFVTTHRVGVIRPGRLFMQEKPTCYSGPRRV